jgi:hypothetical protein
VAVEDDPVEDHIDALYRADPDEFVTARQALVKRLRSEGERDRAAAVAKLRRPTAAAWAVNQLAHRHPDELARLLELGHELHRAHERLLAGDRDDATVTSGRRRHEAIADLVERAAGILSESGRAADAHRDAIASTLDAASLDPDVGVEVAAGRLSKELDPPSGFGLGGGDGGWPAPPPPAATPRAASPKASPAADTEADARAERAAAERARRADEVRQRATTARSAAIRARELADQARDAADRADADLERLEAELVRARRTANDSRRAARELRDAAHEAERQAAALEREMGGAT